MKPVLLAILLLSGLSGWSQRTIDVKNENNYAIAGLYYTVGGEPVSLAKYVRVIDGTPFFSEQWMLGSLIVKGGTRYDNLMLRLDLVANEVHYMDSLGNPFVATSNVSELWLTDVQENKRYHFLHSDAITSSSPPQKGWYQMLTGGPVVLFKQHYKYINEMNQNGVKEQSISTKPAYFILVNKNFSVIKKIGDISGLLGDKRSELESYIKANNLSNKSEGDYINLVGYYNGNKTEQ
jgi:hypothetical protein